MYRRLVILLFLVLALGACPAWVFAEQAEPATRAKPDSAEVERNEQEPALERSDLEFRAYAGKRIRMIQVTSLDVFGPSLDDTAEVSKSWAARFANHLSFRTRETTVRRTLLFREGDTIDPFRLAESERLLRDQAFIADARIVVTTLPGSRDSADVRVIVKNAWAFNLTGSVRRGNRLKARLVEHNLLGLGHQISVGGSQTPNATPRLGYHLNYSVPNINGSFVTGTADYVKMPGNETAGLAFFRDLISPVLRYAGGLDLRRTSITVPEVLPYAADNSSDLVDFWAGRLVHRWRGPKETGQQRFLFASGRIRHLKFTSRPPVTPSAPYPYHDADYFLGSLTYIHSWYYYTNLLYNFGRTEHIPYGLLARVTYGLADEEVTRSSYASATLAAGKKIGGLGYEVGELRIGGYPKRGKMIEQGVIRLRALYFSNLVRAGRFRFRQFVRAGYIAGIHRHADDSIDFRGDEGIRGAIYDGSVTGSKRLQLGLESVTFTPWKVQGVTFALFTFADLDIIGSGRASVFGQNYYSGLGLGVRLHKDAYGIGPVQLRFAWYPSVPLHHAAFSYTEFAGERFRSIELLGIKPEIVEY